jgi:hypothetical protein
MDELPQPQQVRKGRGSSPGHADDVERGGTDMAESRAKAAQPAESLESIIASVDREFYAVHPELKSKKLDKSSREQFAYRLEWNTMFNDRVLDIVRGMRATAATIDQGA